MEKREGMFIYRLPVTCQAPCQELYMGILFNLFYEAVVVTPILQMSLSNKGREPELEFKIKSVMSMLLIVF